MAKLTTGSNITAPTKFIEAEGTTYAYRRFGNPSSVPILLLQHFLGTMDNWDPALTDSLSAHREVILFDNAGVGGSTGTTPDTMEEMARHVLVFLAALRVGKTDILGFSLGGCLAQLIAVERAAIVRKMILAGTSAEGGDDIMHLDKPELARYMNDPSLQGYDKLAKMFFTNSPAGQLAGSGFVERLKLRRDDLDPPAGAAVAKAQAKAFQAWESNKKDQFRRLANIDQPCLVIHGLQDLHIGSINGYLLAQHLPNAALLMYPDAAHGVLFQFHDEIASIINSFLDDEKPVATLGISARAINGSRGE